MSSKKTYLVDSVKIDNKDSYVSAGNISGKALLAIIDATHSGFVNRNFFYYTPDGMRESYHTWTAPYRRPVLTHHRLSDQGDGPAADPIGRVWETRFLDDERGGFTQLDARVTDEDAKTKIIDGRYHTVSTRVGPVDFVECTICGSNILKEGFCGHPRGKTFEDEETGEPKLAYWKIGRTMAREISFVNLPADQSERHFAGVINWEFSDQEKPDFSQAKEAEKHPGIFVFADGVVLPDSIVIGRFKDSPNEDSIVNRALWEHVNGDIQRYADMGGLVLADSNREAPTQVLTPPAKEPDSTSQAGGELEPSVAGDTETEDIEWTEDDLQMLEWLVDELDKELQAQPKTRQLTNKVGAKGKVAHAHVASINQAGNGYTDYVLGHSHRIVDNRIWDSISDGDEKGHSHEFIKQLPIPKEWIDSITAFVTGFPDKKDSSQHRHVIYGNEAQNGYTDYVVGHSHEVVSGRVMPTTADGEQKTHSHKIGQMINLEDQWLDNETWDIVDLPDAKLSEKQKKAGQKAGKKFCGPNDPRKGRKSFPAWDCCLTAETEIPLLDGTTARIGDLPDRIGSGEEIWVYGFDLDKRALVPARVSKAWLAIEDAPIFRIRLDNGEEVLCTGNHPFLLKDMTYRRADELKTGDALVPLYRKMPHNRDGLAAYEQVYQPWYNFWEYTHHMVAREYYGRPIARNEHIHHRSHVRIDNSPTNLEHMDRDEHTRKHFVLGSRNNELYRTSYHSEALNHTVISVEPADRADAYDLEVPETNNFALKAGVIVHNSHVRAGLRLLSRYKGPGDKSKIRGCLKRQNQKLGCGVKASDEQAYALIELLTVVLRQRK